MAYKLASRENLPTGTVTFLFTDIVGSTPLWESHPELMAEALEVHNTALHSAIEAQGGMVFKTVGDAFQCAFPTAPQALRAAIAGQRALQEAPWNELGELKVRMGLHTGEAQLDPGGDEYAVSHTKNRIGRIHSAAHGGQILISAETKELVSHHLPEGVMLKDLGEHRLKGMQWLEHLYQVCALGLQENFPSLATTITHPNNLPLQLTSFIGREKEIEAVCSLLSANRMVTLTGVGGTGKTRLSLHVAGMVLENYPNGAWLVELAGLSDRAMVPRTVALAFNLPEITGKPVIESLVEFLREKRLLLILDNCEHLLDTCIDLADRLLRSCPDLTLLASSREFLGVVGEIPYRLPPMALPDTRQRADTVQLSACDAVKLFTERARVVAPDFAITADNAPAVVQVVERLNGIPLAIELAAARLRLLSVAQVAQRLDDAFRLLTGGSRSALPRHQTLRASIDWSYNLLSESERLLLRRLSVFAGNWSLGAAEVVCADEPGSDQTIHPEDILDLISMLLDKSLIQTISGADGLNRFRMLETIRQYTHEKLVDEKEAEAVRTRHLAYYLDLAETLEPKLRGREQIKTLDRLGIELDNIRLALEWGLQTNVEAQLRLAAALMWFWHIRFHWSDCIDWLEKGLAIEFATRPASTAGEEFHLTPRALIRAKALLTLGHHRNLSYHFPKARPVLEESLGIYRQAGVQDNHDMARVLLSLGNALRQGSLAEESEIRAYVDEAIGIFRKIDDPGGITDSLMLLGKLETDPVRAMKIFQEGLAIAEAMEESGSVSYAQSSLGLAAYENGDYAKSRTAHEAARDQSLLLNNLNGVAWSSLLIGVISQLLGDFQIADRYVNKSLAIASENVLENEISTFLQVKCLLRIAEGHYEQVDEITIEMWRIFQKTGRNYIAVRVLNLRSRLARLRGDKVQARECAQEAFTFKQDLVHTLDKTQTLIELGHLALQDGDVKEAGSLWREGLRILRGNRNVWWGLFFPLDALAVLAFREGKAGHAVRLFGTRWARGAYYFLSPDERTQRDADLAALREALGDECFDELYDGAQTMSLEEVVAYALEGYEE